jgi:hypothetical protein
MSCSIKDNLYDCKIRYLGLTRLTWLDYGVEIIRLYKDVQVHVRHIHQVKNDIQVRLKIDDYLIAPNFSTAYC